MKFPMLRRFYSFFPKNNVFLGRFCFFAIHYIYLLKSVLMRPHCLSSSIGVGSGGKGDRAPPYFHTWYKYSKKRLKSAIFRCFFAIFWSFFCCLLPPWKRLDSAIFWSFLLFFWYFFCSLFPGNFSADALESKKYVSTYPILLRFF